MAVTERTDAAINSLRSRAKKARNKLYFIVGILLLCLTGVAVIDVAEVRAAATQTGANTFEPIQVMLKAPGMKFRDRNLEDDLRKKFAALIDVQMGPLNAPGDKPQIVAKPQYDELEQRIDKALEQYAKADDILVKKESSLRAPERTDWETLLKWIVLDLGTIAFGLFFIQIALNFMRYYAQLAELYEAQAEALLVAEGNHEQAATFLKQFSPTIEFGRTPTTIYEKALDTVKDVVVSAFNKKPE